MKKDPVPLNSPIKLPAITELKKSNPAFFKSFYSSPVAKALISIKTQKYIEVNDRFLELFECSRKQVNGWSPDELNLWANPVQRKNILKQYKKKKINTFNFDIKSLKGNIKNVIISTENIEINGVTFLLGAIIDNTEKFAYEKRIEESEAQYKHIFYKNPLPMWILDYDTLKFIAVNNTAIKHYGYNKSEFLKMKLIDIFPKEELQLYRDYRKNLILGNKHFDPENAGIWKHKKKNGKIINVETTRTPVIFEGKKAILILANDVTSLVESQNILNKKNKELNLLYRSAKEISSTLDPVKIYEKIYKIVSRLIPCNGMVISSYDYQNGIIKCNAAWLNLTKLDTSKFPEMPLDKSGSGIQSKVILSGKPIIIHNFEEYTRNNNSVVFIYKDSSIKKKLKKTDKINRSALVVPIILNRKVIGVFQVLSYAKNAYNQEHLQSLEAFSAELSAAISNARLFELAQNEIKVRKETENKLLKTTKEVSTIYELSKDLSDPLKTKAFFRKVFKYINRSFPYCDIGISIYDHENKLIKLEGLFKNGVEIKIDNFPSIKYDETGKGIQSSVIKSGKSRVINDYREYLKKTGVKFYIQDDGSVSNKKDESFEIAESALIVPLLYEGNILGTIQLLNFSKEPFTEDIIKMIEALASHIAVSYMNTKLFQQSQDKIKEKQIVEKELKDKTEELQILYDAQQVLSGSLDIETIYERTYKIISSNLQCDSMIISSYNDSDKMIRILSVWSDGGKPDINIFPPIPLAPKGYGIQSEVIRSGKPLLINNYNSYYRKTKTRYSYTKNKLVKYTKIRYNSALIVPMIHEKKIIGVIQLLSYTKNAYNELNLKFLESLSGPITPATFNASLYKQAQIEIEEKQKAREELTQLNKEITLLYSAGRDLLSTLDLEEIYEIFYSKAMEVIPCDSMIISRYDRKNEKIYCKAAWVESTKHDIADFPPLNLGPDYKGTQTEAIVTGSSIMVNNFYDLIKDRKDKFLIDDKGNIINSKDSSGLIDNDTEITRSALYIPMKLGRNVIGVISVFSFKENAYNEYHLKLLESISVNLSVAAANAELYNRSQIEIAERIKKEEELKLIKKNLEEAQRISHLGSWVYDKKTNKIKNSEEVFRILGVKPINEGIEFENAMNYIYEDDKDKTINIIRNAMLNNSSYVNEDRVKRPDGEIRYVKAMGEPVLDKDGFVAGMQGSIQDITEIKRINDKLVKSISDKELLLKEIHHRVKNNLQIVSSLLRLQAEKIKDDTVLEHFKMSEQRIKSMALIHQQLYRTKDFSNINFKEYLVELCYYLLTSNDTENGRIKFKIEAEELYFGIDTALPCGLITNELFTNAVKHAFPEGRNGNILLKLYKDDNDICHIEINDDGVGAANLDLKNSTSLGMELVNTLTDQLEGKLSITVKNGTQIKLSFRELAKKNN